MGGVCSPDDPNLLYGFADEMDNSPVTVSICSTAQPAVGGYEYEFLDDPMPQKFLCIICTKVLKDARLTECCGQNFCDSCLTHWLSTREEKKTCPHCQQDHVVHILNRERSREVNELRIRCTYHKEGCGWVGELGGLKRHLESETGCGYVEVTCPYSEKHDRSLRSHTLNVKRKDLKTHMNECKFRPYKCEHCNHQDTYEAITEGSRCGWLRFQCNNSHYDECPEYPLPCPNKCGAENIKRKDMDGHRKSCPLETLDCPFKDAGCTEKIARKDMDSHMESNTQHILKLFHSHQELVKSNRELVKSNRELVKSNRELEARVKQLEKRRK